MKKIAVLVEGHGDALSAPVLIRRYATERNLGFVPKVLPPQRVPRSRLLKAGELERSIEFLARKVGDEGAILVLLDADDDCPAELGTTLRERAMAARSDRRIEVVLAKREYEAWFLAAATSLRGRRTLANDLSPPSDAEAVRDAKGWLDARMESGYSETIDQPAFTGVFALSEARAAPSYRKLERSLARLLSE